MIRPLHPFEDPLRRCLKVEAWPDADRLAWKVALSPGDILDGTMGEGHHWCAETREKYRKGYGRWLTFLITTGHLVNGVLPADRVTDKAILAYVEELVGQVAPWTMWGRIAELLAVIRAFAPDKDWRWLRRIVGRLEGSARSTRDKHARLRPATEIFDWALKHLRQIRDRPPSRHAETRYRDALSIALLISCPTMRLGNLAMIEIGHHLLRLSECFELRFSAPEMKARKPVEIPVPTELTAHLECYLRDIRPVLLARGNSGILSTDRLWITRYGEPLEAKGLHAGISGITRRAFGRPINPHLFRDCAVTTVALEDPLHIGIAPQILGHTDPRTTEVHYIQAQQVEASRRHQAGIQTLRRKHPARQTDLDQQRRVR